MLMELGKQSSFERIRELKKKLVLKTIITKFDKELGQTIATYRPGVKIGVERARLLTEAYKKYDGEPEILRKAKAFAYILDNMTVYIDPHQLIVGNEEKDSYSIPLYVELDGTWVERYLNTELKEMLSDDEKEELLEIIDYWKGRCLRDKVIANLPDDVKDYVEFHAEKQGWISLWGIGSGKGRCVPDFGKLFKTGLKGIIQKAEEKLLELKKAYPVGTSPSEYIENRNFFESVVISLSAVCRWAKRYAELAIKMAKEEKNERRKKELEKIAEICAQVPENPPRSFHEALQFIYFIHIAQRIETNSHGAGYRLDQILYPFYKKDVEEGRLTKEEAQELLECFYIKLCECGELTRPSLAGGSAGVLTWQTIVLGGIESNGSDATNELSYIMLDAMMDCRVIEPDLAIRYHDGIPEDLIDKALDVTSTGHTTIKFFNDKIIIPYLMNIHGISPEDARNYLIYACVRWGIPGKIMHVHVPNIGYWAALKSLELALYQGIDKFSGKILGYPTPDPTTFRSFEEVLEAYLKQTEFIAQKTHIIWGIATVIYDEFVPRPFSSGLFEDCIEKGKPLPKNLYMERITLLAGGLTNVANSLAVIKKLVFDDKIITMSELVHALRKNWEGYEWLRQKAINDVPKFGNDDPYVDELMKWVHIKTNEVFRKFKGVHGGEIFLDSSLASGYYGISLGTGATPDGRKDRDPFADASVSPAAGTDKKGPTAVINSVGRLNPIETGWNHLLNQRFLPQLLQGENREIFKQYLKTWSDLPIWHIQFNVVSNEILRDAQKNPEKYQDLVVRVAGYSAYFVELPKEVQDDIIKRTEQAFVCS